MGFSGAKLKNVEHLGIQILGDMLTARTPLLYVNKAKSVFLGENRVKSTIVSFTVPITELLNILPLKDSRNGLKPL